MASLLNPPNLKAARMIDRLLQRFAGYLVAALFGWLGVRDGDELFAKAAKAMRNELMTPKRTHVPDQVASDRR